MKHLLATTALVASLAFAGAAWADTISIGLQDASVDGGVIQTLATGDGLATLPVTAYGDWTAQATAAGTPPLPEPTLDSGTIDVSTNVTSTLFVWVTETGLTIPMGVSSFLSGLTANAISTADLTAVLSDYLDPSDAAYGTADELDTASFTLPDVGAVPVNTVGPDLAAAYSLTQEYAITCTADSVPCDADLTITTAASELDAPADTLALMGLGLVGMWLMRRRSAGRSAA